MNEKSYPEVRAEFAPITGWKLFIGEKDVTGFIPRTQLLQPMNTRKRYPNGFSGYTYADWIRTHKWVKALADGKATRLAIYSAIKEKDWLDS